MSGVYMCVYICETILIHAAGNNEGSLTWYPPVSIEHEYGPSGYVNHEYGC
jgi:hypothetical protein